MNKRARAFVTDGAAVAGALAVVAAFFTFRVDGWRALLAIPLAIVAGGALHMLVRRFVLPTAVIFDVDGTLADVEPYRYLVRNGNRDFEAFHYAGTTIAKPILEAVALAWEAREAGHTIIVVSGRANKWTEPTRRWLTANGIPFDLLYLDLPGPHLPDAKAKEQLYWEYIFGKYRVVRAVEDRPSIAAVWRSFGVKDIVMIPGWNLADGP